MTIQCRHPYKSVDGKNVPRRPVPFEELPDEEASVCRELTMTRRQLSETV